MNNNAVPMYGFGGGKNTSELNFDVKAYSSLSNLLADSPSENTIGIVTDTEITSYIFSYTVPAIPSEGMVWISTLTNSKFEFDAIKENSLMICPYRAQQYINGKWINRKAQMYKSNTWSIMFSATINITYYVGFVCTAMNDGTIFTAPDTSGTWNLVVQNVGAWTFTCGDIVKKIDISTNGSTVNVPLAYLIYQGGYCESLTGGYEAAIGGLPESVTNGLRFQNGDAERIRNKKSFNIKPFSKICISISGFTRASWIRLCFGNYLCAAGSNVSGSVKYVEYVLSNTAGVQKFAIPDTIPDDVYVSVGGYACDFTISDIWLE